MRGLLLVVHRLLLLFSTSEQVSRPAFFAHSAGALVDFEVGHLAADDVIAEAA